MVVFALNRFAAALVALAFHSRRFVVDVIGGAAVLADAPARKSFLDRLVRDLNVDDFVDDNAHRIKCLGLRNCPREAVQHIAVFAVVLCNSLFEKPNDHFIRHEISALHILFGFEPELGAVFDSLAQDVAGRDGGNFQGIANDFSLGAFSGTRGA